jgi:hypothetical protein
VHTQTEELTHQNKKLQGGQVDKASLTLTIKYHGMVARSGTMLWENGANLSQSHSYIFSRLII